MRLGLGRNPLHGQNAIMGAEMPQLEQRATAEQFAAAGGHFDIAKDFKAKLRLLDPAKILAKVIEDDMGKQDVIVPWSELNFTGINSISVKDHGVYALSDNAFEQLCGKLTVPSAYLKKCPLSGKAGRQDQLEYWRDQAEDREIMLRLRRWNDGQSDSDKSLGSVRAILSKSYEAIDNHRLYGWMMDAVNKTDGQLGIIYANINQHTTHFRLCFQEPLDLGTMDKPDPHFFGIHISDSEVGARALQMDYMMFRLACMNGLIMLVEGDKLLHQKHIHVDYPSLGREVGKAVDLALEHRDALVDVLEASRTQNVKDPHSLIRRLARHYKLTNDQTTKVIDAYEVEAPPMNVVPTKYHVIQAFTRAARNLPMDTRHAIEETAGQILAEAA